MRRIGKEISWFYQVYSKYKRDKSLGILCQQFIGLFVTWRKIISLEEAAK